MEKTTQTSTTTTSSAIQVSKVPKKTGKFRLQAKNISITFPQNGTNKKLVMERLLASGLAVKLAVVVTEKHASGDPHLHMLISLEDKLTTRNPNYFDYLAEKHGNYQSTKNVKSWLTYIMKFDQEPEIYGEIQTILSDSKKSKSDQVAEKINTGSTLDQIAEEHPGYFLLNKRKVEEYMSYVTNKRLRTNLVSLNLPITYTGQDQQTSTIVDWLNMNILQPRSFKQAQIFISGPPNYLKTSLVQSLYRYLRVYDMPLLEDFYDFYNDDDYDLVVLDEFKGQKTVQFMNLFLQGGVMNLRKKGQQVMKRKNLPMIVLSNFVIEDCYRDQVKVASLKTRFVEVNLVSPIDLDNIKFE